MAKKDSAIAILVLRIITLILLVVSLIILATNKFKLSNSKDATFRNVYAYRYLLSVDAIGGGYMLIQILLSIISIGRRTYFDTGIHFLFLQFFDLVFALFFATGVGAGFGLTLDAKKVVDGSLINLLIPAVDKYFKMVYVSSSLLLMATITVAAIILCSTNVLVRK